ncbi:MAG: isoprenylcysteine carboxylmethyltransferase family protein, partial [Planctomycetia bacterium]|nr:isoprenylcysteine carboxylmethyltransferase family protein [Planctomycetia bacterium]
ASFLYAVGFVGNHLVPKAIDSGAAGNVPVAVFVDAALLGFFAVPHGVMARPWFKRWWTRFVPPPVERSTYVLTSSLLLGLLFWQWRPIPGVVWEFTSPIGHRLFLAVFWTGWAVVLLSTFLIDHFDLIGLRQAFLYSSGRAYIPTGFKAPFLYRWVRHPVMLGFLLAFWGTPTMTVGHLLFATATTAYVLIALRFEERDLARYHGQRYEDYKRRAGLFLPRVRPPCSGREIQR